MLRRNRYLFLRISKSDFLKCGDVNIVVYVNVFKRIEKKVCYIQLVEISSRFQLKKISQLFESILDVFLVSTTRISMFIKLVEIQTNISSTIYSYFQLMLPSRVSWS